MKQIRLIDADEAVINLGFEWEDIPPTTDEYIAFLKRQKQVDAILVVHGNWIDDSCSRCGFEISQKTRNYCPNCGAIMDGKHGN